PSAATASNAPARTPNPSPSPATPIPPSSAPCTRSDLIANIRRNSTHLSNGIKRIPPPLTNQLPLPHPRSGTHSALLSGDFPLRPPIPPSRVGQPVGRQTLNLLMEVRILPREYRSSRLALTPPNPGVTVTSHTSCRRRSPCAG